MANSDLWDRGIAHAAQEAKRAGNAANAASEHLVVVIVLIPAGRAALRRSPPRVRPLRLALPLRRPLRFPLRLAPSTESTAPATVSVAPVRTTHAWVGPAIVAGVRGGPAQLALAPVVRRSRQLAQLIAQRKRPLAQLVEGATWVATVRRAYPTPEAGTRTQYVPNAGGWHA